MALACDCDAEISGLAHETIACMRDCDCSRLLSAPSVPEWMLRYFLSLEHARPDLLPTVLAHPAAPQDSIVALASGGASPIVSALLQHLDLLKTAALEALKTNPGAAAWALAQDSDDTVFRVTVDMVQLNIAVTDKKQLCNRVAAVGFCGHGRRHSTKDRHVFGRQRRTTQAGRFRTRNQPAGSGSVLLGQALRQTAWHLTSGV